MADFHQHGIITTLHHLETLPLEELEAQLMSFRKTATNGLGFTLALFGT